MSRSTAAPPPDVAGTKAPDARLRDRLAQKTALVAVVGLGYVGLPLVRTICEAGFRTLGFDIDGAKVRQLREGASYIRHIPGELLAKLQAEERLFVTSDPIALRDADAILIAVPTPLTPQKTPDLSYVVSTTETIAAALRPGHLVVLESTTYPGTTREVMRPILEATGLKSGRDFFLAYSPEREDPGNTQFSTATTPKVVGGDGPLALELACLLYGSFVTKTVAVSSLDVAEAVKLTENIFRSVNIALVNELKVIYEAMGIDIWEVIEAAKTKPFGFMPFYPGPGLGGHCIPIDPFYLSWKAREHNLPARFIELAGEINTVMPHRVVSRLRDELNHRFARALKGVRVLMLGVAYKPNIDDPRESPALKIIEELESEGAVVEFHDPYLATIPLTREHPGLFGRRSIDWSDGNLASYDCAVIVTDHDKVDYAGLVAKVPLVVDTRNATKDVALFRERIVKA
jgi:UDP-N-acetyl-D-glucosamine dehydrogenase